MPSSSLPPGPKLPSFGQGFVAARYPIAFLERCRRRYGDCFTMRFPFFGPVVYVADPGGVFKSGMAAEVTIPLASPEQ